MNASKRIQREAAQLRAKPCREFLAYPCEDNAFIWMFTLRGPEGSCYEQGVYHGKLLLPSNYPMAPPDVVMTTPNGRFETNVKICLSEVTSYHPENWQPSWGVHTVLHALRGFMNTPGSNAVGAIEYPLEERERLARESRLWVSPEGASMAEHLRLLDSHPPWAEREGKSSSSVQPQQEQQQQEEAVVEAPKVEPPSEPQEEAEQQQEAAPAAAPTPPQQQQQQPRPDPQPAEAIPVAVLQLRENTLNNFIVMLLVGIFAILSKKYFANELFK